MGPNPTCSYKVFMDGRPYYFGLATPQLELQVQAHGKDDNNFKVIAISLANDFACFAFLMNIVGVKIF